MSQVSNERDQLQILVLEKEAELQRLQGEIRLLKTRQNSLAPISQLPTELLARTFFSLVQNAWEHDQQDNSEPRYHRPPPVEVTHVCRQWRNTALSYPRLWTRITRTSFLSRWAEEQLVRSKDADLHVQVPQERTFEVARRVFKVLEHFPRFQSLCISAELPTSTSALAPNLPLLFQGRTHQLRHLCLNGCVVSWSSGLFSGLTSLKLSPGTTLETESMGSLEEFLDAMERMPALTELVLAWIFINLEKMDSVDQHRVVRMLKLERATFQVTIKECISILNHLALPNSARVSLQAMTIRDGRLWFDDHEIQSSLLPALGSSLQKAFLSNPLSNSKPSIHPLSTQDPNTMDQTPSRKTLPIRSLCLSITDDKTHSNKAAIEGWFQNIDFWQPEDSPAPDNISQTADNLCTPFSLPLSDLSVYVGVARHEGVPAASLGHSFLRMLPLPDVENIAIEGTFLPETFKYIGELPSLSSVYLKDQAAIGFLQHILEDTAQATVIIDTDIAEGTQDDVVMAHLDIQPKVSFAKLWAIDIEGANFGFSDSQENEGDVVKWDMFVDFLRFRRDVLRLPIHRISLYNCADVSESHIKDVQKIVSDVSWGEWV